MVSDIERLIREAKAAVAAMTPEQQAAMLIAQRESWVRGEMGIGNDADERAYRAAYRARATGDCDEPGTEL
jgi:hypothetical protein